MFKQEVFVSLMQEIHLLREICQFLMILQESPAQYGRVNRYGITRGHLNQSSLHAYSQSILSKAYRSQYPKNTYIHVLSNYWIQGYLFTLFYICKRFRPVFNSPRHACVLKDYLKYLNLPSLNFAHWQRGQNQGAKIKRGRIISFIQYTWMKNVYVTLRRM